jgi:hypothetical protein
VSSKDRRRSYFLDERRAARRAGSLTPSGAQRLEMQVELETALSETVYDKEEDPENEPETPMNLKTPTRRRPLRCMSEPRPLSPEFGSTDAHELDEMIRQHESRDTSESGTTEDVVEPRDATTATR